MQHTSRGPMIWGLLLVLGVIWGASFPAVSVALRGFGPVTTAASRILIAAILLISIAILTRKGFPTLKTKTGRRIWLHCLGLAVFTNALPFTLLSWGQLYVTSGFAGISMAIVPLAVLPMAHLLVPGEHMTPRKLLGFLVGFLGVAVLIGPRAFLTSGAEAENLARLACFAATICYATGSIVTRLAPPVSQLSFSATALLLASLIMVPVAFIVEGIPQNPPLEAVAAIAYLGLLPTALATVLLVTIINRAGPSFLSLVNYQVPIWAALMGVFFLAESLPTQFIGALALILAGLAISQSGRPRKKKQAAKN